MKQAWIPPLLAVFAFAGCGLFNVSTGASTGTGGTTGAGGTAATGVGPAQGVDCGVDPNTGVTLCLGISLCPGITVDSEVYPQCGFLVTGDAITIECVCGTYLCPLGLTTTCAAAQTLLAQDNEGIVCAQASEGQCTELGATSTSSSSSSSGGGSGGGSSGCDMTCEQECDGDPTCIQYTCGC
jgi:hypothetical protein